MGKKPTAKQQAETGPDGLKKSSRGSHKMLLAAALLCMLSLGGGFFLARMAYLQDAEAYAPEYQSEDTESHTDKGDGHGKKAETKLRTDITDPLAKDGHDAEKAMVLKADKQYGAKSDVHDEETKADSGLLDFGEMLTNIESFDSQGQPTTSFLKLNLIVAYRPDEGSGELMKQRQPFMRDLFNGYLRGLTEADLRGMAGILYVKAELLKRARAAVGSDLPQEILINDLIIQ